MFFKNFCVFWGCCGNPFEPTVFRASAKGRVDKSGGKGESPLPLRSEFSPNFFVNELRKGVRETDGGLALRGRGRAELCKAQIVTWHQPPIKKNKKRGTQKFWLS